MNATEERYQRDLFADYKPKKAFLKNDNIVPKTKFSLTLSLEKIVFLSIAIVMAMVALYAFGVERGKALNVQAPLPAQVQKPAAAQVTKPAPAAVPQAALAAQAMATTDPKIQAQGAIAAAKPYTVVAATFARREWAEKEIERLKKSGQEAGVYQSSGYFLVCIGSYQTKDEAKEALSKIRTSYKDAYLRSR